MIDALLTHIKDYILLKNPLTFHKGFSGGRLYQDGKVVLYEKYEGEYIGLGDSNSNYFYIRYLAETDLDLVGDQRTVACRELTGVANLRLVAWVKNANLGKLQEILLTDLMDVDFGTLSAANKQRFSDIKMAAPFLMMADFEQIYLQETLQEEVKMVDNITLTAVDFGLTFNYRSNDDCLDRTICEECT